MRSRGNIFKALSLYGIVVLLGLTSFGCAQNHVQTKPTNSHIAIEIENGWVRAMPPVAKNSAAYMNIINHSTTEDRLISVSSSISEKSETHEVVSMGDMMSMREVANILIPAKGSVELKPGSFHIMLLKLKKPVTVGDRVQLHLTFEKAGQLTLSLPVKENGGMGKHNMDHGDSNMGNSSPHGAMKNPVHQMKKGHRDNENYPGHPMKTMDHKI